MFVILNRGPSWVHQSSRPGDSPCCILDAILIASSKEGWSLSYKEGENKMQTIQTLIDTQITTVNRTNTADLIYLLCHTFKTQSHLCLWVTVLKVAGNGHMVVEVEKEFV